MFWLHTYITLLYNNVNTELLVARVSNISSFVLSNSFVEK